MTDATGPILEIPTEAERLAAVRELEQSVAHAALAHVAALYEARAAILHAAHPERPGCVRHIVRIVRQGCGCHCSGLGICYTLDDIRITLTIRECECVRYEIHYRPISPVPEDHSA